MNKLKKMSLGLLFLSMSASVHAQDLVVAYTVSSVPFSYKKLQGEQVGFNVDMAHAICERLEENCVYKAMLFPEMLPGVSKGDIDIALPNMLKTPKREKKVAFSVPYWRSTSSFVGPTNYTFNGAKAALETDSICVVSKTRQYDYLKGRGGEFSKNIIEVETSQATIDGMTEEKCTLLLMPTMQVLSFVQSKKGQGYNFLGRPLSAQGLGGDVHMIVRPDRPLLLKRVDKILNELISSGVHEKITRKYFPFSIL